MRRRPPQIPTLVRRASGARWTIPLLLAACSALAAQSWFRLGTLVAGGDNVASGFLDPGHSLRAAASIWGYSTTATGGPDYYPTLDTLPALFGKALSFVGAGPEASQRAFLTLLFAALAPAMYAFLRVLLPERRALGGVVVGALFYAFDPALFFVVPNAVLLTSLVLLPLLPALVLRGRRSRGWRAPALLALASLPLSYAFENPPAFALVLVCCAFAAVVAAATATRPFLLSFAPRAAALVALVNAWWLVPAGLTLLSPSARVTADVDPFAWAWTQSRSSIGNVLRLTPDWSWPKAEYFPYAHVFEGRGFLVLGLVPAAAALTAVAAARGRRRWIALAIAVAAAAVAFLAKGLHAPLAGANAALYRHVPEMWLFREPAAKFTPLLAALFAVGMALLVASVPWRWPRRVVALALAGVVAALSFPLWLGQVIPDQRPALPSAHVRIPSDWRAAAAFLDARPGPTLLLPPDDYYQMPYRWGFYGADVLASQLIEAPTVKLIDPRGSGYLDPDPSSYRVLDELRARVETGRYGEAAALARALGIRWVLVRRDIDSGFPGRAIVDPTRLAGGLVRSGAFHRVRSFGDLDVLAPARTAPPLLWAPRRVLASDDSAALPLDLPLGDVPAAVQGGAHGLAAADALELAPAEWRDGATVSAASGGYEAYLRWSRGAAAVAEREPDGTVRLRALPLPTSAGVLPPPFAPVTLTAGHGAGDAVLTVAGELLDLSAGASRSASLTLPPGPTRTTLYAASVPTVLRTWGAVGDCNRFDRRTLTQAGIRAQLVPAIGGGTAIELSARAHSACVSQPLPAPRPGGVYRLSFDYQHRQGETPRICLWQASLGECLPLPALSAAPGQQHFDQLVEPARNAGALRLFLYADGDGHDTTTNLYSHVTIEPYVPTAEATVDVPSAWVRGRLLRVNGGRIQLRRVGFAAAAVSSLPASFARTAWGAVGDCNRFDRRTLTQAGIRAQLVPAIGGGTAIELSARAHSACVSQPLPAPRPGGVYRLSFDYQHRQGETPRICLWQASLGECLPLPALSAAPGQQHFDQLVEPARNAGALRLFLYADGDGHDTTTNLYSHVKFEALPAIADVALLGTRISAGATVLSVDRASATDVRARVRSRGRSFLVVLDQTYDPGWRLSGASVVRHVRVDGWANGWIVRGSGVLELRASYAPQRWVGGARLVSGAAILLVLLLLGLPFGRRPRLPRWRPRLRRRRSDEWEFARADALPDFEGLEREPVVLAARVRRR